MKKKSALITGVSGQDGSYLAEFLIDKGYIVHGLARRSALGYDALRNIKHLMDDNDVYRKKLFLHSGDMADNPSLYRIIGETKPQEIYNLAAQADVQESFLQPEYTIDINGIGVIRILEVIRQINPKIRFYQASTSELFGNSDECPQNENTKMNPQSPYAIGKFAGYQSTKKYREMYNLFACNGICYNHESERRGDDYVTRKITKAVARIKLGLQKELRLGNLEAKRDWGYSKEYVEVMWKMLQQDKADDYVIGTGETHTVKEWVDMSFAEVGLEPDKYVIIDPKLFRPAEVYVLQADYSKAKKELGFEPKIRFKELVKLMVKYDLKQNTSL